MYQRQQGFTLIELMIVVVIIAVLAGLAIPAYQDYTARTRVIEGLNLAQPAKLSIIENAMNKKPFRSGWQAPSSTRSVDSVVINETTGDITISYTAVAGDGTLVLSPRDGNNGLSGTTSHSIIPQQGAISWNCNAQGSTKAGAKGTLLAKYAPSECR